MGQTTSELRLITYIYYGKSDAQLNFYTVVDRLKHFKILEDLRKITVQDTKE